MKIHEKDGAFFLQKVGVEYRSGNCVQLYDLCRYEKYPVFMREGFCLTFSECRELKKTLTKESRKIARENKQKYFDF